MATGNPHSSIITLNVNALNSPINRQRVADWIKKQNLTMYCLQETHLSCKDKDRLKAKGWKRILQENNLHRKADVVILRPHKIYFKITKVTGDRDGHFIMIKGTLHQEDIILLYIYKHIYFCVYIFEIYVYLKFFCIY